MNATTQAEATEQLALSARQVAKLLGISVRHVWTLHATGQLPQPVRLRRSVRWRREELIVWLDAGCPSRERFETECAAGAGR